jgi:hypothetical protein
MIVLMLLGAFSTYSQTRAEVTATFQQKLEDTKSWNQFVTAEWDKTLKDKDSPVNKMSMQADLSSTYKAVDAMNQPARSNQVLQIQQAPFTRPSDRTYQISTFRQ